MNWNHKDKEMVAESRLAIPWLSPNVPTCFAGKLAKYRVCFPTSFSGSPYDALMPLNTVRRTGAADQTIVSDGAFFELNIIINT